LLLRQDSVDGQARSFPPSRADQGPDSARQGLIELTSQDTLPTASASAAGETFLPEKQVRHLFFLEPLHGEVQRHPRVQTKIRIAHDEFIPGEQR
jgi:hypothetical protein